MNERDLFTQAMEIDDRVQRAAFVEECCHDNPSLRSRLMALLKFHEDQNSFLSRPVLESTPPMSGSGEVTERPGSQIGRYKLLEEIGEGGFGVVYMAEQCEPVHRRVALKIVKLGMDTRQVVGRFEVERQALAIMDHPNIAKVLDGGTTPSGRPYFVMELVKGFPITDFCDAQRLNVRERLRLFGQVCDAVQHAHHKGVIHRDLKPGNVLVAMCGECHVPKIIDFGVAKAVQGHLTDKTVFTRYQQIIGTPAYMSPEQATFSNLDVDTRSDVYSLGVLLYELLTGTTPLDLTRAREVAYGEICRIIREEEPTLPSQFLTRSAEQHLAQLAKRRNSDSVALKRTMRGDVDWIVMKALDKDRSRRYETASAFRKDIEQFLADQPVAAGPPSLTYRLKKFVRRNHIVVTTASILSVSAIGALIGLTYGVTLLNSKNEQLAEVNAELQQVSDRAENNLMELEAVVDEFVTEVASSPEFLRGRPGTQRLRKSFLYKARDYWLNIIAENRVAGLQDRLAASRGRLGFVLRELGEYDKAFEEFQRVIRMAHTRQDVDGFDKMSAEVAQAHFGLGLLHQHRAESREAAEQYSRAIEIFTRRHNVSECGAALVRCNLNLGNVQLDRSDPDAASRHFEVALEICQKLLQTQPSPEHRELLVRTEINVARVLNRQGWHQQAVGMFEEAIRRGEQLAGNHSTPNTLHALAIAYHDLGACHELIADKDAAIDNYEQAMEIGKKLVSENPFVPDYWDGLATAYSNLGRLNVDVDRDRSVRLLDNAIRIYERRPEMFSEVQLNKPLAKPAESAEFKVALSTCYITKAVIYGQRETQYALSLLEKAQNTLLSLSSDHPRIRSLLDHTRKLQTHIDPVQVEAPSVQARHPNQIAPGRTRTLSSQPR